jgi:hypothetical protein
MAPIVLVPARRDNESTLMIEAGMPLGPQWIQPQQEM